MTQLELALGARVPKQPPKPSSGRMTVDAMAAVAVRNGSATSPRDFLRQVAGVRDRAYFNAFLAVLQLPRATMLCSVGEWEGRWGRRVRPGERPVVLLFPCGPVEFVFDLSQTEATDRARQLPVDDRPFAMDPMTGAEETLQRLRAAAALLGVRVVDARHGTPLAGMIRPVDDGSTMAVPVRGTSRTVPVRWVTELNSTHAPTEKLATLAHELGHLLCGHVGADVGDPWPSRAVAGLAAREFEAESVAELVFGRIAPDVALPPYLDQYLDTDAAPPGAEWSYVVQAADRVLDMCGPVPRRATGKNTSVSVLPVEQVFEGR